VRESALYMWLVGGGVAVIEGLSLSSYLSVGKENDNARLKV
jgi:hypothetical protein